MQNNTTLITATATTASAKTYTHAGVSLHPKAHIGYAVRFGNSANRFAKELGRYGHTEIRAIALSKACTEYEAVLELQQSEYFADELAQNLFSAYLAKHSTSAVITA
jgi:hypothetical protein